MSFPEKLSHVAGLLRMKRWRDDVRLISSRAQVKSRGMCGIETHLIEPLERLVVAFGHRCDILCRFADFLLRRRHEIEKVSLRQVFGPERVANVHAGDR